MYDLMEEDDTLFLIKKEADIDWRWLVVATFNGSAREMRELAQEMLLALDGGSYEVAKNEIQWPDDSTSVEKRVISSRAGRNLGVDYDTAAQQAEDLGRSIKRGYEYDPGT